MTEHDKEKMGFREWTAHYEREQEADRDKLNDLASIVGNVSQTVGKLSANVETLMDNQKGMFNRLNRPWQWGVVISVAIGLVSMSGMFATILTLTVNPIKDALAETSVEHKADRSNQMDINIWQREAIEKNREDTIRNATDLDWIKKLEERVNNRAHKLLGE